GNAAVFAFLLAAAGGLVVNRAARADVTWAFLAAHAALVVGRALWLGDPLVISLHRLSNGALVLFAFFIISDPRTTPDSRAGRLVFAVLVAVGAYVVQFRLFQSNPLLWSLAACSLVVPLIDRLLPGHRYDWKAPGIGRPRERSLPLDRLPSESLPGSPSFTRRPRGPSVDSTLPRPTPSSSTRPRRWCWSATRTRR